MALKTMKNGRPLDLSKIVMHLRSQRHGSVQTVEQWLYIFRSLVALALNKKLVITEQIKGFIANYDVYTTKSLTH